MKYKELDMVAWLLMVLGALNWGLVGAFKLDLVQLILGTTPALVQLVYILIGLAGLYGVYMMMNKKGKK